MPEKSGIFYTEEGNGFPVILIHGFCETHEIWKAFSKALSKDFRVLCIDLPGFGQSYALKSPFSIADAASKVFDWIQALKINSCVVIGHSLGGYVSLAMAEKNPDLLKAFGLFHSTAFPDTEEKKLSRNKVIEFVSKHGVHPFIESFIPPLFFDQANPHILPLVRLGSQTKQATLIGYVQAMRDRPDRRQVVQNFKGDILFIAGEKDGGIQPDSVREQASLNPRAAIHVLPNIAHMGMFEAPELTIEKTRFFLSEVVKNGL